MSEWNASICNCPRGGQLQVELDAWRPFAPNDCMFAQHRTQGAVL